MNWNEANTHAHRLWAKWVSDKPHVSILTHGPYAEYIAYDLDRLHACILQEYHWHLTGRSKASEGLIREVKGELVVLGKIRKALV